MGVDFSHCHAGWAYSGFRNFRCRLWNDAGFSGRLYDLYEGPWPCQGAEHHPLYPLFNHSDCDGILTVEEMKKVEPTMRGIIELWPEGDYDRDTGLELARGMRTAIKAGEPLEFR